MCRIICLTFTLLFGLNTLAQAGEKAVTPFNGKDLTGWKLRNNSKNKWSVGFAGVDDNGFVLLYQEGGKLAEHRFSEVQAMFGTMPASIEYVRAGKLRPLAVTSARRSELLPDLPTVGDFVPGYETSAWQGIGAPKNTPAEIINKFNKEINAGLADPKINTRLADLGGGVFANSPTEYGKLIAAETEKWAKVVKFSGAKPD